MTNYRNMRNIQVADSLEKYPRPKLVIKHEAMDFAMDFVFHF